MTINTRLRAVVSSVVALAITIPMVGTLLPTSVAYAAAPTLTINEINWAGSVMSPNDQWIELYNNGSETIDFAQHPYAISDATKDLVFIKNGTITPNGVSSN